MGLSTFSVDYRGYGMSAGYPTEEGLTGMLRQHGSTLVGQRGIDPRTIIIYGKSLGGIGCHMACPRPDPRYAYR